MERSEYRPAGVSLPAGRGRVRLSPMAKSLYIIDGHAYIYAAYFAPMRERLTSPAGEPTKATYIFTTALLGLLQRKGPDMLVVAFDSKEPSFRCKLYAAYKAHRPPMPDDMPVQIDRIEQILQAMNIAMLRAPGYEADDVIGTVAKKAGADGIEVLICSKDKDMLQLIDSSTSTYDMKTDSRFDLAAMEKELKVSPEQFVDVLALQGDAADNVPGVPDVGPKTAIQWIQQYGSLENLFAHADDIAGRRGENLRKHKEDTFVSRKLVTIDCDVPLAMDYERFAVKKFDEGALARLFTELGFNRLLTQLDLGQPDSGAAGVDVAPEAGPASPTEPDSAKTVPHDYQLVDTPEKFSRFLEAIGRQKLFALDTETTSLAPMEAQLVGMSFCWRSRQAYYLPVTGPVGCKCLGIDIVRRHIGPILADESVKKIGQNIKFDMLVLRNAGLPLAGAFFDTMVASYCLDAERGSHSLDAMALDFLGYRCVPISALIGKGRNQLSFDTVNTAAAAEYAAEDADITFQLYEYLSSRLTGEPQTKQLFEQVEMPLVCVLAQMEYNGVCIDVKILDELSRQVGHRQDEVMQEVYKCAGVRFNLDSPKQLAEVLFDRLGLLPLRTGKTGRSTDADVLEELSGLHPVVELISEYRQLSKLKNTYLDKLPGLVNCRTNRVHASFNQTITATGRLSSSNPNLQNIPARTQLGRQIRSAFLAQGSHDCLISADYSQIELRLLAHFSCDQALMRAFALDQDIHRFVASQIFDVPIEQVTDQMRSRCKAVNFGIIYGQGPFGLSRTIGISQTEARQFIDKYFARYKSIQHFRQQVIEQTKKAGYAETILHRRRRIAGIASRNANNRSSAERMAINTVIQGSAADLIKVAMINIQRRIDAEKLPVRMILQIHDELVFELPEPQVRLHGGWIAQQMTGAIKLDVPLKVDLSWGRSWLTE
jgi:DNA polymerase-1